MKTTYRAIPKGFHHHQADSRSGTEPFHAEPNDFAVTVTIVRISFPA